MPNTLAVNQENPGCKSSGDGQREVVNDDEALDDLEALTQTMNGRELIIIWHIATSHRSMIRRTGIFVIMYSKVSNNISGWLLV